MADSPSPIVIAAARVGSGVVYGIGNLILPIRLLLWDLALTIYNLCAPLLPADRVVPQGRPGARGLWPQYIPPTDTDSRSCCPMLNAMANHGAYGIQYSGACVLTRGQASSRATGATSRSRT